MQNVLLGTYPSVQEARRVRDELVAAGVAESDVFIHGGPRNPAEPLPEDSGLAGFIGRMFSGALGDSSSVAKYRDATRRGEALVGVRVEERDAERLTRLMRRDGTVEVHSRREQAPPPLDVTREDPHEADANEAIATASGPEGNVLPNSSTGWNTSRHGSASTIGRVGHDPARPQADTEDIAGLGTDADRRRTGGASGPREADASGAPDAYGHRVESNDPRQGRAVGRAKADKP